MTDQYANLASGLESPAGGAFAITPNDAAPLTYTTRALYIGATGNVSVQMLWGGTVTFNGVQAGSILPLRVTRVLATATTAAAIVGIY